MQNLSAQAMKTTESIIFIEEINAFVRIPGKDGCGGTKESAESTAYAITTSTGASVIDISDPALIRAGRFERIVVVE